MEDTKEFYVHKDHVVAFVGIMEKHDLRFGNICTDGDDSLMITVYYDTQSSSEVEGIEEMETLTEND